MIILFEDPSVEKRKNFLLLLLGGNDSLNSNLLTHGSECILSLDYITTISRGWKSKTPFLHIKGDRDDCISNGVQKVKSITLPFTDLLVIF